MAEYKDLNDYEVMYLVEEGNDDARDIILEKYKPIIKNMAFMYLNQFRLYRIDLDDLIQEGYLGLYNAITNYHDTKNVLFYTYAIISIRSKMLNYLKRCTNNRNLVNLNCVSLNQEISDSNMEPLLNLIVDTKAITPDNIVEELELELKIRKFILSLDFPESLIFELKFNGFGNRDISILLDYPLKFVTNLISKIRKKCHLYLDIEKKF